ncbi:MAG: alpha/beta hydrolase, partial [Myxococcota bacterium]|nr:alpha/beta hydrolase [Myxococcota bacterium]
MTAVFVHGAPVTPEVWRLLRERLPGVPSAAPNLPGFGTPLPGGFEPTMTRFAEWRAAPGWGLRGPGGGGGAG